MLLPKNPLSNQSSSVRYVLWRANVGSARVEAAVRYTSASCFSTSSEAAQSAGLKYTAYWNCHNSVNSEPILMIFTWMESRKTTLYGDMNFENLNSQNRIVILFCFIAINQELGTITYNAVAWNFHRYVWFFFYDYISRRYSIQNVK